MDCPEGLDPAPGGEQVRKRIKGKNLMGVRNDDAEQPGQPDGFLR